MKQRITLLILAILILSIALFFVGLHKTKNSGESAIFTTSEKSLPNALWSKPAAATMQTGVGSATGQKISGKVISDQAMLSHFENTKELKSMGYKENMNLSADGPGSSTWGYTNGDKVIIYSYTTNPTSNNSNEPLSFDCPCKISVSVFTGTTESNNNAIGHNLANPASTNCAKVGGTTAIKDGPNGDYGLCEFEDNMACEEWALYRGDCPVGGVKTTGYDTIQQMYCAWVGGQTLAVANPNCKLPNGTICADEAVYNGTCSSN